MLPAGTIVVGHSATARSGWIGGPWFDALFFFGSGVLALAVGLLVLALPAALLPVWYLWIWLVEGPHLLGTWQRTYFDPQFRRERPELLMASLLWLVPGPLLLAVTQATGRPEPFLLFLGAAALWSFHHTVRQHHGLLSIYQRLGGSQSRDRRLDSALLHGVLWTAFVLFQIVHPANRAIWHLPAEPGTPSMVAMAALGAGLLSAIVFWIAVLWRRHRSQRPLIPGLFALVVAVGTTLFSIFVVGLREPLFAGASSVEQMFLAVAAVSGIVHGVQYIGIVIATSRKRAQGAVGGWHVRLGRAPLLAYAAMLVVSLAYVALNLLRGATAGPSSTAAAQWFLALYWGLFLHHFWLDQRIWKPSADARLRRELGVAG